MEAEDFNALFGEGEGTAAVVSMDKPKYAVREPVMDAHKSLGSDILVHGDNQIDDACHQSAAPGVSDGSSGEAGFSSCKYKRHCLTVIYRWKDAHA